MCIKFRGIRIIYRNVLLFVTVSLPKLKVALKLGKCVPNGLLVRDMDCPLNLIALFQRHLSQLALLVPLEYPEFRRLPLDSAYTVFELIHGHLLHVPRFVTCNWQSADSFR